MMNKQAIPINFAGGLDTKTDPFQVQAGKFLNLKDSVFTKGGLLQKRNGFGSLMNLPDATGRYATTFNGDLTVIGTTFQAYSTASNSWVNKGSIRPIDVNTLPLIRNNTNQSQADTVVAPNGLVCTVYTDQNPANLTQHIYKFAVADSVTGQNIVQPTQITAADPVFGTPQVYLLGNFFVIVFTVPVVAIFHLQYIAININQPSLVVGPIDLVTTAVQPATTVNFDGVVANNNLYVAWNGSGPSGIFIKYLTSNFFQSNTVTVDAANTATLMSVSADTAMTGLPIVWMTYSNGTVAFSAAVGAQLNPVLAPTQIITTGPVLNITSYVQNGVNTFIYEVANNYGYDASIPTHFLEKNTITQSGTVGTASILLRSVGLASKAFAIEGVIYVLSIYVSPYQSTYFLTDINSHLVAKLAYGNASGYLVNGLPSVTVTGDLAQVSYLFKDLITAVNKNTDVPSGSQTAGIYSQLGINLASFNFETNNIESSEIGNNLNITGGFLWAYDGYEPVEQEFFLYPDSVEAAVSSTVIGNVDDGTYFYQVTYEWTDNQGNAFRSAPSIPFGPLVIVGAIHTITINVPTLRLTYKTKNPVKIVVYRWSVAQPIYYQVTSIIQPVLNDPTVDFIAIQDGLRDNQILGNNALYTTGGVLENIAPPATSITTLFDDRLWLVDAEDQNLLWFSKQVIEATPVEMSDLLTIFVASNIGATGSTGPIKVLSAMDDKLIIFKQNAIYYINGTGPDNTGANNQYSPPIFITAMVGSSNIHSVIFQPQGLMFEYASDAGNQIWMLGRGLDTSYIGAPVEALLKNATVLSAITVPGTNQVRFNLSSGITLMYDYYYGQWGTFSNNGISSTLFQDLHTYIDHRGAVFQESPGKYLDGSKPVVMSFSTSWIKLAELQGYQRAYFFYLLGLYFSPFKLALSIAYDYASAPSSFVTIDPLNFTPNYGSPESNGQNTAYGTDTPYGGPGNVFNFRVFMKQQRCSSFQLNLQEIYDPSFGAPSGQGISLSGLNLVVAVKKGFRPISSQQTVGAS